ncbi:MAG: VOC family protein [Acetobacteraceae bacterium]|nr:VOC family protein [Acetobacteraceae bacterium]
MEIQGMNHFTIIAEDLEATRRFYTDILGLTEGYRPPLPFPGLWFYVGENPVLHVIGGRKLPDERAGVLDHMAFTTTDLPATEKKLQQYGIKYELGQQVGSGIWQLFFHDPNGAKVELDFGPDERR